MHGAVILGFLRRAWPALAVLVVCLAWGLLGYQVGTWRGDARVASIEVANAAAAQAQAEALLQSLRVAAAASDTAVLGAQTRSEAAERLAARYRNELETLTDGRDCLGADARRVLNQSPAFGVPTGAVVADRAASGAAADPRDRFSTDRDLSLWIAEAAVHYERCRARVDAIREWSGGAHGR